MGRRHRLAAATVAVVMTAGSLMAISRSSAAAAEGAGTATQVRGGVIQALPCFPTNPTSTNVDADEQSVYFECESSTNLAGSWTGVTHARNKGTIDLATGDVEGTLDETFIGVAGPAAEGSFGTIELEGTLTLDGATYAVHVEERILGGTGDFEGSRGYVTFDGFLPGPVGVGGYSGLWIRP